MKYSGLPEKVRIYLENGRKKIVNVVANNNYTLTVSFDNGEVKVYSMFDKLDGIFEVLKDREKFKEVFMDEDGNIAWDKDKSIDSGVNWNNRIDICVDAIYLDSV